MGKPLINLDNVAEALAHLEAKASSDLVDANILIYATNAESDQHAASRDWLYPKLSDAAPVGLPWASPLAFLRIATNPRAFRSP